MTYSNLPYLTQKMLDNLKMLIHKRSHSDLIVIFLHVGGASKNRKRFNILNQANSLCMQIILQVICGCQLLAQVESLCALYDTHIKKLI